jgi:hypothetical protein
VLFTPTVDERREKTQDINVLVDGTSEVLKEDVLNVCVVDIGRVGFGAEVLVPVAWEMSVLT